MVTTTMASPTVCRQVVVRGVLGRLVAVLLVTTIAATGCGGTSSDGEGAPTPTVDESSAELPSPTGSPAPPAAPEEGSCRYLGVDAAGEMQVELTVQNPFSIRADLRVEYILGDAAGTGISRGEIVHFRLVDPGEIVWVEDNTHDPLPSGIAETEIRCEVAVSVDRSSRASRTAPGPGDSCRSLGLDPSRRPLVEVAVRNPFSSPTRLIVIFALRDGDGVRVDDARVAVTDDLVNPAETVIEERVMGDALSSGVNEDEIACTILAIENDPAADDPPSPSPSTPSLPEVSIERVLSELPVPGAICDHTGPVVAGDVIACSHPDGRGILVSIVDDAGTWVGGAAEQFPTTAAGLSTFHTDLGPGQNCTNLLARDLLRAADDRSQYLVALAYFYLDGQSYLMDIDENAVPCETLYSPELVAEVFAGGWLDVDYPSPPAPSGARLGDIVAAFDRQLDGEVRCDDPDRVVGYGDVILCDVIPSIDNAQPGRLGLVILSDDGHAAGSVGSDTFQKALSAPDGLNCTQFFGTALTDPEVGYLEAVAYWFLQGRHDLMDIDANGVPCETVVAAEVVSSVFAGGLIQ